LKKSKKNVTLITTITSFKIKETRKDNNSMLYIDVKAIVTKRQKPNINEVSDFLELQK
jgi:hypothetical protein